MPAVTQKLRLLQQDRNVAVAFGNNSVRYQKVMELKKLHLPMFIQQPAQIAECAAIEIGCFTAALSNIDLDCKIRDACIINKLSSATHDSVIESGTPVSVCAAIAGSNNSFARGLGFSDICGFEERRIEPGYWHNSVECLI